MRVPSNHRHAQLFSFVNQSGTTIHGSVQFPPDYVRGRKCATLLSVYGGPQQVTDTFRMCKDHRKYVVARAGFVVVTVDGRGSNNRGAQFESVYLNKMVKIILLLLIFILILFVNIFYVLN